MICFFVGTKAQFIKMAPIMAELKKRKINYRYIDSGQHAEFTKRLRAIFDVNRPDYFLNQGKDITKIFEAFLWVTKILATCILQKSIIKQNFFGQKDICLIHGDTLSTLLGLIMAKAAGIKVAHVEAGLRSFNILHPFPEEIIRSYCMKRCDVLFAPSKQACINLEKMNVKGKIIQLPGNTIVDSLRLMKNIPTTIEIPEVAFVLVTTHRVETITNKKNLSKIVDLINHTAKKLKIVFVAHKPTREYLMKFNLLEKISPDVELLDMLDYMNFITMIKASKIVFTDGGSIQEECAYLNKPCLLLRNKTERPDGLGKNAELWKFDKRQAEKFLERFYSNSTETLKKASINQPISKKNAKANFDEILKNYPMPTKVIIDWLIKNDQK
jgi:UDP-N-acetylglucosamine 2-epimerase